MEQKITQLTTLFLFLIGMFQMQGQLYSGVQVSDVGASNSIGFSNTSKSVVIGNDGSIYAVFNGDAGIRVAKSTNRGQSYLPSVQVSPDNFESEIAISSNGTIYVAWTSNNDGSIYLATSSDGGTTFSAPNHIGSGFGVHIATNGSKVFLLPNQGTVVYSNITNGIGAFTASNTTSGFTFSDIFVDSSNGSVFIIGDIPDVTLFKSTDDGITFNPIVLSTNIDIFYSSYAFSNGNLGAHIFVGGTGTDGYKINLSNGLVTATPLMNCVSSQGRTLIADEFGNFVDGYDDGSTLYFRVSNDQGTTWQLPVTVASGLNLNLVRNHNFQDVVAIYAVNNIIYSNVYAAALASSTLSGTATICEGESANLQVAIVGGVAPYTVVYSDGLSQFTVDNYQSNQTISVNPSVTTNYSLVSVTDSNDESTGLQGTPTVTVINYVTYYLDSDGDGYGNPDETAQLCTGVPLGYAVLGTDCDDTNPTIHPGAVDVCYDGIDNDCNGVIDNVEQPSGCIPIVSQLVPSLCGVTVSRLNASISCTFPNGAQGFRFKVIKVDLVTEIPIGDPIYIDRPVANFSLSSVTAVSYNSKYQIEVSVKYNNVYQPFNGIPCYITTPNPSATIGSQCGTTLSSMSQWINATIVPQVGSYKFRVTQLNSSGMPVGTSQEFVSTMARFNMTQFVGVLYNTNYNVEVSLRNIDMVYLPYNAPCTITTPAYPTTQVREAQCNEYLVPNKSTNIYANIVSGATTYRFRVYLVGSSNNIVYDFSYDSSMNRVTLNNFPGLVAGTTYTVQVAVRISGQSAFGPYSTGCTIVTPNASRTINSDTVLEVANVFEAIAYPNPFAENFKLEVKTNNEANLEIRVYDMIGKLVEQRTITTSDIQTVEIGSSYPSGVYNVIVSQGETTKTLRVIKR